MPLDGSTAPTGVTRIDGGRAIEARDHVAVERGLEVRIDGEPFAVVMRTPGADRDLAAGFLFSENVIRARADVLDILLDAARDVVDVRLSSEAAERAASRSDLGRRVTTNASCGMCGRASLAAISVEAPAIRASWSVRETDLVCLPAGLARCQPAFAETGGLHAAVLADRDGRVLSSAEDVGRHNAVDKLVGQRFLADRLPLTDTLLFVSGRTSFEIVQKAWLAGVPIVAAVSAPSSLAIELAEKAGITLIGFLRDRRFNVYSGAGRVIL